MGGWHGRSAAATWRRAAGFYSAAGSHHYDVNPPSSDSGVTRDVACFRERQDVRGSRKWSGLQSLQSLVDENQRSRALQRERTWSALPYLAAASCLLYQTKMSKHVPASASLAMAGEALQGWNKLEEKLASKLSQLTKLLHHFSAFPPESPDGNDDEIAEQHESEIHEILNETASRIRQFKMSLEIEIQDNRVQETIEAMSSQYEALRKASEIELNGAKSKAEQLEKDMDELEKAMEEETKSFLRDLMQSRNELLTRTKESESAKQTYMSEVDCLKRDHETERLAQSEKAQKELLEMTQQRTQLQARVSELQEMAKMKLEEHTQTLEGTKALLKAEVERLKLESFIELEKISQDCASREAEWHAQEKEITGKLQNALHQAEEEKKTLKENLSSALSNKDNLSIAFETLKKAALDAEKSHGSAILEWESRADRLRADLENMTKACAANESDRDNYKVKVDELAFQLVANRKEMNVLLMEIDQLKKELQISSLEVAAKEEERRRVEAEAEVKVRTLKAEIFSLQLENISQNEESSRKMKEILETRIQQQLQSHEQNVQSLQKSFLSQLEEHRKGSELLLESMEDKFRTQKEEKARAKEACAEYLKALREVEQKMEDQELKFLSHFQSYANKIVELVQKLDTVESKGPALEDDFNSLLNKVLKHTDQSKQVGMNLQQTKATCAALEKNVSALMQEHGATSMKYIKEIQLLKQTLSEEDHGHKLALAAASQSHSSQMQRCMNDMQRLEEEHHRALAELRLEHQLEIDALSTKIQAQKGSGWTSEGPGRPGTPRFILACPGSKSTVHRKFSVHHRLKSRQGKDAEMAEQGSKLESCLRRNKMECSEEIEIMNLEHEKALRGLRVALETAEKREARLVRAHMNASKSQQEESEEEIQRCKKACKEAVKASEAVSQKLAHELDDLKEDHIMEIQEMNEKFQLQLSSVEKEWRHRLQTVEEDLECRLENEQATSRKQYQSELDELRNSLLTSCTEEKLKLETEWKKEVCDLQLRISELETDVTQKDKRIKGLLQVITNTEESSRLALLDIKTSHIQNISDMMERKRAELNEVREEGSATMEELQTKHRRELLASQRLAEQAHLQMEDAKHKLEEKLEQLKKRFESRESREEDVVRIMKLQETCLQKDSTIQQLHDKASQLKLELVNREETYNRIFRNSPNVQQGISDWLRPRAKTDAVKVNCVPVKVGLETSKVDIMKLQKRAASARRMQMKGPDPITRSASNQL